MKMKQKNRRSAGLGPLLLTAFVLAALSEAAQAQLFTYSNSDLCLTFRKVTPYTESNDAVVDIGQASLYRNAVVGTTMPVTGFSPAQLFPGSFASLDNLSWAVFGWCEVPSASYPNIVSDTVWLTVPRANNDVRNSDLKRQLTTAIQGIMVGKMESILANAVAVSQAIAVTNAENTSTFVAESIAAYPDNLLDNWLGGVANNAVGTFQDEWTGRNVENATPRAFSGSVRSDLYEVTPTVDGDRNPIVDPHTGTNGLAWYVGYFQFNSDGTMTFTREAMLPTPVTLSIAWNVSASTISFPTSFGVTYQIYFNNAIGLSTPVTNWSSLSSPITGSGRKKSLPDTSTDPNRFYQVLEHY
jgi:hypothetical protein